MARGWVGSGGSGSGGSGSGQGASRALMDDAETPGKRSGRQSPRSAAVFFFAVARDGGGGPAAGAPVDIAAGATAAERSPQQRCSTDTQSAPSSPPLATTKLVTPSTREAWGEVGGRAATLRRRKQSRRDVSTAGAR